MSHSMPLVPRPKYIGPLTCRGDHRAAMFPTPGDAPVTGGGSPRERCDCAASPDDASPMLLQMTLAEVHSDSGGRGDVVT